MRRLREAGRPALLRLPGVESVEVSARRGTAVVAGGPSHPETAWRQRSAQRGMSLWPRPGSAAVRPPGSRWPSPPWFWCLAWVAQSAGLADVAAGLVNPSGGGLLLVLALGLTAGVSTCMAMVGGLVLGFSASHAAAVGSTGSALPAFTTRMRPQFAFNAGRIIGFGLLGAILGALGSTVGLPTRIMGVLALAVAVVMFLLGIRLTGISPRMAAWSPRLPAGLAGLLGIDSAAARPYSDSRTALVGAGTFFLPCGFTQAVQVYALSTGSPLAAGLIMATFAVGTTPGLLAVASVPEIATGRRRATVLQVVGVIVLAFALLNVTSGLRLIGVSAHRRPSPTAGIGQRHRGRGVQTVRMTQSPDGYLPADTSSTRACRSPGSSRPPPSGTAAPTCASRTLGCRST